MPVHEISNNMVCATSKASDQPAHTPCLSLEYSMTVKLLTEHHLEFLRLKGGYIGSSESTIVKMPHCWKSHVTAKLFDVIYPAAWAITPGVGLVVPGVKEINFLNMVIGLDKQNY